MSAWPFSPSLRAKRSNPECLRGGSLDCFVASLLAMTRWLFLMLRSARARVSKDEGRDETARPSWFETALARLLTMRVMDFGARPFLRHCERSEAIQKWIRGDSLDCFVASLLAMTMHQIAATQTDDPGHQTHLRILAACFARALLQLPTLLSKRAQGRPGAGRHPWPLC